ncbi:hydroxymethylglutaryl-CoA reductase, degradative [Oceanibaculum pacificum]|uniref:3-hydroxy-3-methylglutaryl coenzyme A reductase n=1 Tax=Oceanibaculum pacificum TaxID=580166 RepID=A0A154W1E6_9PROT|nr:hydroxymethylglutaryl-CoA reductase, degradative [Oceanibaculum pacificum]KZD07283.1 3-hydroxy-3-methylglutaryl-CoA reductase [Oceanibaculum pacificum]
MRNRTSRLSGFYKLGRDERLAEVQAVSGLDEAGVEALKNSSALPFELLDRLVENAIGGFTVPVGIATNMIVDGRDVLIPMATEESSVIAAVGNTARQCRDTGGFTTSISGTEMIAQIQMVKLTDPWAARAKILEKKAEIADICNGCDPLLVKLGGGFRDLEVRIVDGQTGPMVVVHIIVDTKDAMGANAVNTMAEKLAPNLAAWTGGKHHLRILSNLADRRVARARAVWRAADIGGAEVVEGIVLAADFADSDPYRAATHNKGIMNGVSALTLATGNDTRAIEAGAHAFAARTGRYRSLSRYEITAGGDLAGSIEIPMALGLVGGATKVHPTAQACLKILGVGSAAELSRIAAAVGLAQNFGALKALATVGIQQGHMTLHAQNVAIAVGAAGDEIAEVARRLAETHTVRQDVAEQILAEIRGRK